MLTTALLSTVFGSLTSFLPEVISYFNKKQDQKFELNKMELQSKLDLQKSANTINELNVQADISEGKSLYDHDASLDGGWFINALRASIRPVLTILFFIIWATIKIIVLVNATSKGVELIPLLPLIWDNDTAAIYGSILGFWFGSRSIEKLRNK